MPVKTVALLHHLTDAHRAGPGPLTQLAHAFRDFLWIIFVLVSSTGMSIAAGAYGLHPESARIAHRLGFLPVAAGPWAVSKPKYEQRVVGRLTDEGGSQ
jgi:hypothetical protein